MENTQIKFRNSWFIQAGIGIIALSALPFLAVILVSLFAQREVEMGPTFLWLILGAGFGCLTVVLGVVGVLPEGFPKGLISNRKTRTAWVRVLETCVTCPVTFNILLVLILKVNVTEGRFLRRVARVRMAQRRA